MKKLIWVLFVSLSLSLQAEIPLAKDAKAVAEIVIDKKADKVLKFAASELQHWVKEISGAKLPVVDKAGKMQYKIFLQVNPDIFKSDLNKMRGNDGYAVRKNGNNLYIFASKSKGVLNGVFKLLFKNTDIIWARPNVEFGTIFSKNPNLTLTKTDYIDIPVYVLRGWQMIGPRHHVPSEVWQVRNGNNWSASTITYTPKFLKFGNVLEYGGGHNLTSRYITKGKYFNKHPEFFSMKNGKRLPPRITQLCFTNAAMTKAFIQELNAKIKQNPNYDTYRIMAEDNWNLCECPECIKAIKLKNGQIIDKKDKAFRSTQFFLWLNQIARYMQKNYPGKKILTFAYFFTEIPPHCKVEPNISISFCPAFKNSKATMQSSINTKTRNKLTGWLKNTKNLTLREYFGLCAPYPRPIDAIAIADWRYATKLGINKTYSEMYSDALGKRMNGVKSWNLNSLYFWTMTNAAWNPYMDVKKLRKEFLKRVYGNGAQDIEKFYSILEKNWLKTGGTSRWVDKALHRWRESFALEEQCRNLLIQAAGKVSKPKGKKMLAALRKTFDVQMKIVNDSRIFAAKVKQAPAFNPDFNSGEWEKAVPMDKFFAKSRRKIHKDKTVLRILCDKKNLYFGIKCYYKDVKKMRHLAPVPGEKTFPDGEGFEIFLHKLGTPSKKYYQMVVDPVNNRYWMGCSKNNWKSQAEKTADGWSAMITVPWKTLKISPNKPNELYGAFIRQYLPQPRKGCAPREWASLFNGDRHKSKTFIGITLKK